MYDEDARWLLSRIPDATDSQICMFIEKVSFLVECNGVEESKAREAVLSMIIGA